MELFTKAIRPFLGEDNKWNNAPLVSLLLGVFYQ